MSSVAQMYEGLLKKRVEFRLFNGNPKAIEAQYNGETYRIPGREEFYVSDNGEKWPEPGILPVKSRKGHTSFRKGRVHDSEPDLTAQQIVEFLVGPDGISGKLGKAGVRLLLPDGDTDGRNAIVRKDAIDTADGKRYDDAQGIIRTFERTNARRIDMKQDPLPPNDVQRAAYRFIAQRDTEGTASSFAFSCPKCFDGAKTTDELRTHILTIHRPLAQGILKDAGLAAEAAERIDVEDSGPQGEVLGEMPKRRGRPPLARA